ncbi:MAG: family 43 glycosylhydrolase, partial [Dysgonamonadaceae bacterium]|nr:family 43 glycosylhydrolase [Dysgonamonadaceae bacterium]
EKSLFARVTVGWQVQNPVLPYSWGMYIADPEVHDFGGQLYVYGSLDASNVFCSPHYMSLTTSDLKRWESKGYSYSSFDEGCPYPKRILWDPDGSYYNGKYLLYGFFEWDSSGKDNNTFVLESDSPTGRFKNFRWIVGDRSGERIDGISAQIFVDGDGQRYISYAPTKQPVEQNYPVVAKLIADDTIDESSVKNLGPYVKDFYEAPSLRKRGDTYYLVYAENCGAITDKNHVPTRLSYATSKEIFGEYTYRGVIITLEGLSGNGNIQGSIEPFNGEWYVFYHRGHSWNRRAMCIEKLEFDSDGLIKPVVPTSSGVAEGFDTSKPINFNTAVIEKNCSFGKDGKYGCVTVKDKTAEIGFRYVKFTGKEKSISFQGKGLENIESVKILVDGKVTGEGNVLHNVPKGKAELTVVITAKGEVRLETLSFEHSLKIIK